MEVTQFYDDKWEDFLNVPKKVFFDGYGIRLDGAFEVVMQLKFLVQLCLSAACIMFYGLFILFLLSKKHFRSWMFFPIILQGVIGIFCAGFMNIFLERVRMDQIREVAQYLSAINGEPRATIHDMMFLYRSNVGTNCFKGFSGMLLNEYSTGYCILAVPGFPPIQKQVNHTLPSY